MGAGSHSWLDLLGTSILRKQCFHRHQLHHSSFVLGKTALTTCFDNLRCFSPQSIAKIDDLQPLVSLEEGGTCKHNLHLKEDCYLYIARGSCGLLSANSVHLHQGNLLNFLLHGGDVHVYESTQDYTAMYIPSRLCRSSTIASHRSICYL